MKVFVDTNVVLDVLLDRKPFYWDAGRVWTLAEQGRIQGLVSVLSFPNAFYVIRRTSGLQAARESLLVLRDSFTPIACDEQVIQQAIDAKFADFEDAIQFFSALRANAACIVTRNAQHFPVSELPVLSPAEFMSGWEAGGFGEGQEPKSSQGTA